MRDDDRGERDGNDHRLLVGRAGLVGEAAEPGGRQLMPEPHHGGARNGFGRDQRQGRPEGADGSEAGERRDAEEDREDERGDAESADPAVVHDLELPLRGRPAAEAVDGVGEAVLVQAAGQDHGREHRERRGDQGRLAEPTATTERRRRRAPTARRRAGRPAPPRRKSGRAGGRGAEPGRRQRGSGKQSPP